MAKKIFLVVSLFALVGGAVWWSWPDNLMHVVFCDVGQGDAALIWRGFSQLVVDGGPDDKILDCLGRHLPFFDRAIEMAVVTHPQSDHMNGITFVAQRYSLKYLFMNPEQQQTAAFAALKDAMSAKHILPTTRFTSSTVKFKGIEFRTVWPTREWVESHMNGAYSDGTDLNGFGIVGIVSYGNFDVLLTADADSPVQPLELSTGQIRPVEVLKVPHHGSKTGMNPEWLDVVHPAVAVISSGKNNRYGHPAAEALKLLRDRGIKILRTDERGDIEMVSDGKMWWIKD